MWIFLFNARIFNSCFLGFALLLPSITFSLFIFVIAKMVYWKISDMIGIKFNTAKLKIYCIISAYQLVYFFKKEI